MNLIVFVGTWLLLAALLTIVLFATTSWSLTPGLNTQFIAFLVLMVLAPAISYAVEHVVTTSSKVGDGEHARYSYSIDDLAQDAYAKYPSEPVINFQKSHRGSIG